MLSLNTQQQINNLRLTAQTFGPVCASVTDRQIIDGIAVTTVTRAPSHICKLLWLAHDFLRQAVWLAAAYSSLFIVLGACALTDTAFFTYFAH